MRKHIIDATGYGIDAVRALEAGGVTGAVSAGEHRAKVLLTSAQDASLLARATASLLLDECACIEARRAAEDFELPPELITPVSDEASRLIRRAVGAKSRERTEKRLVSHIGSADITNLEGFMRFRMRELIAFAAAAAERAADTLVLRGEYLAMLKGFASFARSQAPRTKEVRLVLNADGSCTLCVPDGARIRSDSAEHEGLISILLALAPESIIIYDLSCGRGALVCEAVARVFSEKVRLFR